jgi:hypothetical protein
MSDLWGPISPTEWRGTPCLSGRIAVEADVKEGRAVFFVKGGSNPAPIQLPCCALQMREDGSTTQVVVIQAEYVDGKTLLGVRFLSGGNGICLSTDVQMIESGFEPSLPPNKSPERTREG